MVRHRFVVVALLIMMTVGVSWTSSGQGRPDPATNAYTLRSHAMGNIGDFVLTPAADGHAWEIPAGPMTIRYTAVIKDSTWRPASSSRGREQRTLGGVP